MFEGANPSRALKNYCYNICDKPGLLVDVDVVQCLAAILPQGTGIDTSLQLEVWAALRP